MATRQATKQGEREDHRSEDRADLVAMYQADVPIEEVALGVGATVRMVARRMAQGLRDVST